MSFPATSHILPLLLVAWPLLAALLVYPLGRRSESARDGFVVFATGVTLLGAAALLPLLGKYTRIHAGAPLLLGRLEFTVDHFSALFALFSAFVWFCATVYSLDYMKREHGRDRYHATSLVVLAANLGVVLAGNLVTLFLFFEALGLVAFLLVVHAGTGEAKRAAVQYVWMTILGGVALLAGIMLVYALGGGALEPVPARPGREGLRVAAAVLLVLGFGVKAGIVPLHIWLPNAHPVAPSPASALLSGVMIKAGAYGIFRSVFSLFRPEPGVEFANATWAFSIDLGLGVLWIGIATMAVGVVLALGQRNAKRMLAYHSISQMGFILAGLGAGAYLAGEGALGTAGGLLHAVNHALFKACLFLGVGAVAFRTGRLDMYELGGLWRRMPFTFVLMLIAAAGIIGMPLFNGFVSKCLIHHALESAYAAEGSLGLLAAERIYLLVCAGTAASFFKLIGLVFIAPPRQPQPERVREAPAGMLIAMAMLAVPIIVLGLRPGLLLESFLAPGLAAWTMPGDGVGEYLARYFMSGHDVLMALFTLVLGAVLFIVGMYTGLFHLRLPRWLGVEYWYHAAARGLVGACRHAAVLNARLQQRQGWALRRGRRRLLTGMHRAGDARRRIAETLLAGLPGSPEQAFIESAWLVLEEERNATVRAAVVGAARRQYGRAEAPVADAELWVESARAIAGLLAGTLFDARLAMLLDQARAGDRRALRTHFDEIYREFPASRAAVAAASHALAGFRRRGDDILPLLSGALEPILARERSAWRSLEEAEPADQVPEPAGPSRDQRAVVRGGLGTWLRDVGRLVIAELRQPPSAWPRSEALDTDPNIIAARRKIQRYARDIGWNVATIFLLLALLMLAL